MWLSGSPMTVCGSSPAGSPPLPQKRTCSWLPCATRPPLRTQPPESHGRQTCRRRAERGSKTPLFYVRRGVSSTIVWASRTLDLRWPPSPSLAMRTSKQRKPTLRNSPRSNGRCCCKLWSPVSGICRAPELLGRGQSLAGGQARKTRNARHHGRHGRRTDVVGRDAQTGDYIFSGLLGANPRLDAPASAMITRRWRRERNTNRQTALLAWRWPWV